MAKKAETGTKVKRRGAGKAAATQISGDGFGDEIRRVAYELYLERVENGLPGDETADWLAAETRVRRMHGLG